MTRSGGTPTVAAFPCRCFGETSISKSRILGKTPSWIAAYEPITNFCAITQQSADTGGWCIPESTTDQLGDEMPKQINIKKMLRANQSVDAKKLVEVLKVVKELRQAGVTSVSGYNLTIPFSKRVLQSDESRQESR